MASWEAAFRVLRWNPSAFPAPSTLGPALRDLLAYQPDAGTRLLIEGVLVSLARLAIGFAISIALGAVLGAAMWRSRALDDFLGPLFLGLQTLPSVCWAPLAVLAIGSNERGVMFVVVMGSAFAIAIAFRDGLRAIPPIYGRVGAMLGTGGWRMYRYVLLPASLPALAGTLRQGFSFAWRSLMGAEFIFAAVSWHGLGYALQLGRERRDVAEVVVVMAVMVVIGMTADRLFFGVLERHVNRRFGLVTAD